MTTTGLLLLVLLPTVPADAEEILLAVAANFSVPMQQLASQFERQSGHQVSLVAGSSGRLFAQIRHGAPFQLFLSADQAKPVALEDAGLIVSGSRFTYATGVLVLWSSDPNRVITGPQALQQPWHRLALANPRLAPYGRAAVEVLTALGLLEVTRARWVSGENITQTYQFVATGNVELGFVALSQVIDSRGELTGNGWRVPAQFHQPIRQDAVLLKTAETCTPCRQLWEYLQSAPVQQQIAALGYLTGDLTSAGRL